MSADRDDDDDVRDSDEEEEECRVCRGPAEEGRPLFKPCRCSGSIGLTHQDCLTSWLDVSHGDGRCELCSTRFRFAPQYADGTPDRLSPSEVVYRILRRLGAKWLPRGLRALFAAFLWLVILPLSTSYIYHGWMIRPSAIASRWRWELVKLDIVGGAVIAVIIVVSFSGLIRVAEFLRFQWGGARQQQQQRQRAGDRRRNGGNGANNDRALDELLGFRGPLLALIRNLLLLLVFNTAYLGVFAFAPSKFGGSMCVILSKIIALIPIRVQFPQTIIDLRSRLWGGFIASMQELDTKSKETNMIYQPSQIARMGLGYLTLSVLIFLLKAIVTMIVRLRERRATTPGVAQANERNRGGHVHFMDDIQDGHELEREVNRNIRDQDVVGRRLLGVFEGAAAIAKVVILLLIKMLFLPLLLGIWLDLATLALFEKNWSDRVDYAGSDIFGAIFLHWVIGITFMRLVTVSVLQMREVAHPDLLARIIKPQEPQPDLLGNLLRESGSTHTKRVLLLLGIYAILLAIHIWLPARLLLANNLGKYLPLFQPKFWHIIMPQIQVPAELLIFHLCMLVVLEKYKNKIGEMQHHWLLLMGDYLGITDQLLPLEVDRFVLVGALPVYVRDALPSQLEMSFPDSLEEEPSVKHSRDDILPLWSKILSEPDPTKREELIRTNISMMISPEVPSVMQGIVQKNGKKYLSSHSYIRIPPAQTSNTLGEKTPKFPTSDLMPTCIGPYRLKQSVSHNVSWKDLVSFIDIGFHLNFSSYDVVQGAKAATIEVWREVFGKPIPRVGGAERLGRWAWGDEQTSEVENSVAVRTPFFNAESTKQTKMYTLAQLTAKSLFLVFVSWTAISVGVCAVLNTPLFVGRFSMHLLRIPEEYIHDPLAFAIGGIPLAKVFASSDRGFMGVMSFVRNWYRSFKPHHTSEKVTTLMLFFGLWLVICPVLLGFLFCRFVVGISGDSPHWYDYCQFALSDWGTGTLLLNLWAIMCYFEMFTKWFWTWDKVNKQTLLQDCALPVARHLVVACAVPIMGTAIIGSLVNTVGSRLRSTAIFRTFTIATILVDSVLSSQQYLRRYFQAAHTIARDDRYLVGETLLNYSSQQFDSIHMKS
ncbi:hypothetical protein ACHAWU_003762 [Discostella pseudostelligera]|uniref:RING-type E3 ubiquitin transferase n=1 Tax=Discostella pseudostelligera TaxID=259834 RepID=A0ABD3N6V5_9STRA